MKSPSRGMLATIVLVGVLTIVAGVIWQMSSQTGKVRVPIDSSVPVVAIATEPLSTSPSLARSEAPPVESPTHRTARQVLEELWGGISADREQQLLLEGIQLDEGVEVPPWESVADRLSEQLGHLGTDERKGVVDLATRWPDQLTPEWIQRQYGPPPVPLTDVHVSEIGRLVVDEQRIVADFASQFADGLDFAYRIEWQRGSFEKSPLTTSLIPVQSRRAIAAKAAAASGWAAKLRIYAEDYPDLAQLEILLAQARGARDTKVREYLASLK